MKNKILLGACSIALAGTALATETQNYTYDAEGRLIKVERTGSVNNGVNTDYEYDNADNRDRVKVTGSGGSGGGGGGGGGSNNPPIAVNDFLLSVCGNGSVNVVTNDSDPDGDPISATSVTGGMGAYISGGSSVIVTSGVTGTLTYTLTDSNGSTDTASISVFNTCGPFF